MFCTIAQSNAFSKCLLLLQSVMLHFYKSLTLLGWFTLFQRKMVALNLSKELQHFFFCSCFDGPFQRAVKKDLFQNCRQNPAWDPNDPSCLIDLTLSLQLAVTFQNYSAILFCSCSAIRSKEAVPKLSLLKMPLLYYFDQS